jgi:hypothetical protein
MYEPYAGALSDYLMMPLPAWVPVTKEKDQWRLLTKLRTEAEAVRTAGRAVVLHDDHGH